MRPAWIGRDGFWIKERHPRWDDYRAYDARRKDADRRRHPVGFLEWLQMQHPRYAEFRAYQMGQYPRNALTFTYWIAQQERAAA